MTQEAAFDQPSSGILNLETRLSVSDNRLKVRSADRPGSLKAAEESNNPNILWK